MHQLLHSLARFFAAARGGEFAQRCFGASSFGLRLVGVFFDSFGQQVLKIEALQEDSWEDSWSTGRAGRADSG